MTEIELQQYLRTHFPKESTSCEWKEFRNLKHFVKGHEGDDITSYISAISNMEGGHLVIGVKDNTLDITGIDDLYSYTPENIVLKILEQSPNLSSEGFYVDSFITTDTLKTVWVFHIPIHQPRRPVLAHNRPWQRVEDSLVRMRTEREQAILNEPLTKIEDWSAEICTNATIEDLSGEAILKARENYKNKFPEQVTDVDSWNDTKFLNKAKVTIKGKITRAAIILLGKSEAEHFINPAEAKIRWILKEKDGNEKDYAIFCCPFLLSVDEVYKKIRNLKYRYIRDNSLFPEEVDQFEPYVIREAINNCIAHQDYSCGGKINVVEKDDELIFTNVGSFIPGTVDNVIREDAPEEMYRNPFLATAMFNLKMVDTIGSGIRRMFTYQRKRFFPMPDYDLSGGKVKVTITGKVLNLNYARMLAQNPELGLEEIVMLDKVQKRNTLLEEELKLLRRKGLVEGKKPNIIISAKVAQITGQKAAYTRSKAFTKQQYFDWIIKGIKDHGTLSRTDIDALLMNRLSDLYTDKQKKEKINNLISDLRKLGKIKNTGSDFKSEWVLIE